MVVSACNTGDFLWETLDSVLAQTRPIDEIIVIAPRAFA
ncbi:glycosyltransferase family A protein [Edaphobacter modestus]